MKITISNQQSVGKLNNLIFGQFIEHFHRQVYGGIYDPTSKFADEDGFRTDVIEALKDIKVPILRWPGGCFVSAYDWKKAVGPVRTSKFDKAWRVEEPGTFGTDEYIKFCRKVGCEPYICTNAGTGNAEEMSDWVEYCNLENEGEYAKMRIENGNEKPFGVKYWSVGNENWGPHEIGSKERYEWSLLVREAAKMMLRVDPSIELSAASIADLDWNLELFRRAGQYLDWVSIHGYWDYSPDGIRHSGYDDVILRTGKDISESIDRVRSYLTALGLQNQIKIAYDEWNLRGWYHPNIMNNVHRDGHYSKEEYLTPRDMNDRNETYTMADAVFSASFLNICLRNCDIVGMTCFSPIVNTRGAIFTYEDGIVLRPTYYVFKLYTEFLKGKVLSVWSENTPKITGNDHGTVKTVDKIDLVVTEDDGKYAIAVINKDPDNFETLNINFLEKTPEKLRIHTLNGESKDSYNDIGKTDVTIKSSEWTAFTPDIALPPHSISVIELN